jgi:hypothetical protein
MEDFALTSERLFVLTGKPALALFSVNLSKKIYGIMKTYKTFMVLYGKQKCHYYRQNRQTKTKINVKSLTKVIEKNIYIHMTLFI